MIRFLEHIKEYELVLGSRSPRRQQLLKDLGLPFRVWLKEDQPELFPPTMELRKVPVYLAKQKASVYEEELESAQILITADTVVIAGDQVLNKPASRDEAVDMLMMLSGNTHEVITGVCLKTIADTTVFDSSTRVTFSQLSADEISYYIDEFKPFDKAGAYGIQEWIGHVGVTHIEGSYFNVIGLPIQRLYQELKIFTGYK